MEKPETHSSSKSDCSIGSYNTTKYINNGKALKPHWLSSDYKKKSQLEK